MESSACRIVLFRRRTSMGRSIDARSTYSMAIGRCSSCENLRSVSVRPTPFELKLEARLSRDRKSTRLNSSHGYISYAVFCLKKKKHTALQPLHHRTHSSTRHPLVLPTG